MAATYDQQATQFAGFAPESFTFRYIEQPAYNTHIQLYCWPKTKALDIGAGSGRMAQYLWSHGVRNITGVEISPNLVELAKKTVPGATFICGDIREPLALPPASFDLITSHMVLEFLDDDGLMKTLNNVRRLLTPAGKFCVIVTHPEKMRKSNGVSTPGWFETTAPWGGIIQNWYRTVEDFVVMFKRAKLPPLVVENLHINLPSEARVADPVRYEHCMRLDPMRLLIKAVKALGEP